ncbi:MAG: ATP-binding protein [Pseudomonadota bacterium]
MEKSDPTEFGGTSLLARTNLILGCSALLIAAIATVAINQFVIDPISKQSAEDEAALLVLAAQTWVELPPESRPYFELEMLQAHDLIVTQARQDLPMVAQAPAYFDLLRSELSVRLDLPAVELLEDEDLYWVDVPMGGVDLQIGFSPEREDIQPLNGAIVIVVLGAGIVFVTSFFIVQRIARPLVRVAQQAEYFRGAGELDPLPETGPRELASLARNFNTMAQEISHLLANRTTLLAGISHDLKTPLTRMRLALALLPEDVDQSLVARFERNLESMDELISDALRFARGATETAQEVEIVHFTESVLASFEQPVKFETNGIDRSRTTLVALSAFERVLINLVSNGLRHGGDVMVQLDQFIVHVHDNGPGIPVEHREAIFQPFHRLDESRSATTGGSGLGLAIAAQLCEAHGWDISVGESPMGGAVFSLRYA